MLSHGVGYDYIHSDTNGGNMRLDVRSQVKYIYPFLPIFSLQLPLPSYPYPL